MEPPPEAPPLVPPEDAPPELVGVTPPDDEPDPDALALPEDAPDELLDAAEVPDEEVVVVDVAVVAVFAAAEAVAVGTVIGGAPAVSDGFVPPPPHAASTAESATAVGIQRTRRACRHRVLAPGVERPARMLALALKGRARMLAPGLKGRAGPSVCRNGDSR